MGAARTLLWLTPLVTGCHFLLPLEGSSVGGAPDSAAIDRSSDEQPVADGRVARRPSVEEPFAPADPVPGLEQQPAEEPSLSPDELTLYFHSWSSGDSQIWVATRENRADPFSGLAVVANVNSPNDDRAPSISADGLELYLASDRPGGAGGLDLYVASQSDTSQDFSAARRIDQLSTALDEVCPCISPDGKALYLNYDTDVLGRTPGHEADIWVAVRSCQ